MKTIGILTSGGDAPGMNVAIRAIVRAAIAKNLKVIGFKEGFKGLIRGNYKLLQKRSVANIVYKGGTILHSARCPEFATEEGMGKALAQIKKLGIEGMVVIGGDGSFRGAKDLSQHGIPTIGIPATIDGDVGCSSAIGFDTACNNVTQWLENLRDTMRSHHRTVIVEVMGNTSGNLALHAGIAAGAEMILVPEKPVSPELVCDFLRKSQKPYNIIVTAEGAMKAKDLVDYIKINLKKNIDIKEQVFGHIQRGGSPSTRDRLIATVMGAHAVNLLLNDVGNRFVTFDEKVGDVDIAEGCAIKKPFDENLYKISKIIA